MLPQSTPPDFTPLDSELRQQMNSYSVQALEQLVNDGIQTAQFFQKNQENIQKTYGRSAIGLPTTKDRITAWEAVTEASHGEPVQLGGGDREEQGGEQAEGEINSDGNGYSGEEVPSGSNTSAVQLQGSYNQVWDGENAPPYSGGERGNTGYQYGGPDPGQTADTGGGDQPHGGTTYSTVDAGDLRQMMIFDHETSAIEVGASKNNTMKIRNATEEDLGNVMSEGTSKIHKRLRGVAAMTDPLPVPRTTGGPVKKGTEESSVSTILGGRPTSGSGAIPNVHPSLLLLPSQNVHAESAPECVQDVSKTGSTCQSSKAEQNSPGIESKIDLLLGNLEKISRALDVLPEIREEIRNINKKITNLSLGLSTVEGYIKSMMIIIPGSGKPGNGDTPEVNPDLKAVIGRDNTRGLAEVKSQRINLESLTDDPPSLGTIDESHIVKDLDFTKSNAANFAPTNRFSSVLTMFNMIKEEVKDYNMRAGLTRWLEDAIERLDPGDVYRALRRTLDKLADEEDDEEDEEDE